MPTTLFEEIASLEAMEPLLTGNDPLPVVLRPLVEATTRLTGADRVSLILFDWEARQVRQFLRGGAGWSGVMTTVPFEELLAGLSGWALNTGQVALSPRDEDDLRESAEVRRRRRETKCGSILVAPLGSARDRLGTLTAIKRFEDADFTEGDAQTLEAWARTVSWVLRMLASKADAAKARAEAAAALRSKQSFLANLSHELRTPLNGILGFSHLLDTTTLDEQQKPMVKTILQSGQRLLGTVDNILELAQFEVGQFRLETALFSPQAVLEGMLAKHRPEAMEKGLEWRVIVDPEVPEVVEGDAVRVGQAWDHIVSNAVKFTAQGSISIRMTSRRVAAGRYELALLVEDTGIGLTHERSGQWFMPFHQEDGSLTRKFGGTGLGLALCDRLVRSMGGGLSLLGEPGVGTKVRVWVDLGSDGAGNSGAQQHLRVLLQDPDLAGRGELVALLEEGGHLVDVVDTPPQAAERLKTSTYELLIAQTSGPAPKGGTWAQVGLFERNASPSRVETQGWDATLVRPVTAARLQSALKQALARRSL